MTIKLTHLDTFQPKIGDRVRIKLKKDDGIYKIFNDGCGNITDTAKDTNGHTIYYTTLSHGFGFQKSELTPIK